MNLKIVEYSSELYQELYTLLKEIYDSNINQTDLEKYYHVETIIPVDELPQTQNVKIIAKLVRKDDKKRS